MPPASTSSLLNHAAQLAAVLARLADPPPRSAEPGGDRALREALQIDRDVELQLAQPPPHPPHFARRLPPAARHAHQLVERRVAFQHVARRAFHDPARNASGNASRKRAQHGHAMNHVADRGQANDQNSRRSLASGFANCW